jgi:UDP-N-acetylglucosamine--N-acetylmuramyl-(pentapeptide) pyrophosphoryl-undecaprenol N-acetylglucosamine transferase
MAGGTGGHVFPALATANELLARGHQVSWLGSRDSFEARLVPQHGIAIDTIDIKGLRGNGWWPLLFAPIQLSRALWQALSILRKRAPDVVLGMGGFASGPGGLAAWLKRIPLVIHEQNAIAGLTNTLLARLATSACQAFPGALTGVDAITTGNPVRADIAALPAPALRYAQRQGALHLLVLGGSLGAVALNTQVPAALALLPVEQRPQVRHQAGRDKDSDTRAAYNQQGIDAQVSAFIDDMADAFAWADLVIARAGALTVAELAAAGVAACLVPYPHAVDDHQSANGAYLADAGAAWLIAQSDFSAATLSELILGHSRQQLLVMAEAARALALPDATRQMADICEAAVPHD